MNFMKFINSDYLKSNPLCGIDTYKDELNLATGACTRKIKKLVFDGTEDWQIYGSVSNTYRLSISNIQSIGNPAICSHFVNSSIQSITSGKFTVGSTWIYIRYADVADLTDFKTYLQQQYTAGTPVTVWYVLATPTTETITVPSGLSGTEEGYLNQSGTPTTDNPIYPIANTVEQWFDLNHYIMGTSTVTLTTFPAVLYPNDTTATLGLKGNTVQNGTPTPSAPIYPSGCGDKTGNLCDYSQFESTHVTITTITNGINLTGKYFARYRISLDINTAYAMDWTSEVISGTPNIAWRIQYRDNTYSNFSAKGSSLTPTKAVLGILLYVTQSPEITASVNFTNIMLNEGSTALPYEPYGNKIPISSGGVTTNVYLGEVQTTRKIRKLVLTGNEDFALHPDVSNLFRAYFVTDYLFEVKTITCCSHYVGAKNSISTQVLNGTTAFYYGSDTLARLIYFRDNRFATADAFKAYLAQQYAAGTPVTVWYVLATPTTGIVNEQLMKIGDYADEVSGITIPTIAGANALSVDTTVQPSEVTANYHGWHPVQSVHERDNGAWT